MVVTALASLLLGAITALVFAVSLVVVEANANTTASIPCALVWPIPVWPLRAFECVSFAGSTIGSAAPIPVVTRGGLIQLPDAISIDC